MAEGSDEIGGEPTAVLTRDPVCGMEIEAEKAGAEAEFAGRTWYFCSEDCRRKFLEAPASYAT